MCIVVDELSEALVSRPRSASDPSSSHITNILVLFLTIPTNKKFVHNYNKADYDIINECFFNIDWEEMFTNIDTNIMWNKFITIVEEVIDKMISTKILMERSYSIWMTR